jgi:hypothetical protein
LEARKIDMRRDWVYKKRQSPMLRCSPLFVLVAAALCCSSFALEPRAGDPSIDGKDYLISEADFRAILVVSRQRIVAYPSYRVRRVTVVSQNKVEVYIRDLAHPDYNDVHSLELRRAKNGWTVTARSLDRDPIIE